MRFVGIGLGTGLGTGLALALLTICGCLAPAGAVGVGQSCGGTAGIGCDAGLYCELTGGGCGNAISEGKCMVAPQICSMVYSPVCACDGKTYGNDCERRRARVQKAHDGRCGIGRFRPSHPEPDARKGQ